MIDLILAKFAPTVKPLFPLLPAEAATAIEPEPHPHEGIPCHGKGLPTSDWCDGCLHDLEQRAATKTQLFGAADITEAALFAALEDEVFEEVFGD